MDVRMIKLRIIVKIDLNWETSYFLYLKILITLEPIHQNWLKIKHFVKQIYGIQFHRCAEVFIEISLKLLPKF